jgi:hypothetical protein
MQKYYNKKRKLNKLKTCLLLLMMVLFAGAATAQTNVYMHSGTQNVTGTLNFYDSGGASSVNGSYYWEKWYQHNENSTIVFKNGTSPIQVTFGKFHAWGDSADGNSVVDLGEFSLRINNDHLYVYDGENADDSKLICDLTGTLTESFTISANGPITFKFVSDGQYRDEGWAATVTSPSTYTVQQPIITKETCSDYVILYNTAYGATVYYSTDNNDPDPFDPLSDASVYTAPFAIDLDAATASVLVRAIAVANGTHSAVASHTFTHSDQRPTPGAPQINIDGNTVTFVPAPVPAGLNETYNIRYTTNGTEPSATNGTLLTKSTGFSIEWTTPNTTFKAVTVAVTCSSKVSAVTTAQFGNVTVPAPTITFSSDGKATIACSLQGATVYYTTDGTQPTSNSSHGTAPVTTAALPIGTTVYAYATYGSTGSGYDDSAIASAIYVPEGGNGTYNGVVFLDDREDHSWTYYSDSDSPIHSLKPADVKITYTGYGTNTMTSSSTANTPANSAFDATVNPTQVAVNVNEPGNQFIYLKTLENADPEGKGTSYPYTMISNPFQVRPLYNSSRGETNANGINFSQSISNEVRDRRGNVVGYTSGTNPTTPSMTSFAQQGGNDRGNRATVWAETTTITPGEPYLIGLVSGSNIYLVLNYSPVQNGYYYNNNYNYWGYTAPATIDGNGYVTGCSGNATDLQYAQWKFSSASGGTITSNYESNRYLYGATSNNWTDLYPYTTQTTWTYSNNRLSYNNGNYYLYLNSSYYIQRNNTGTTVRLYKQQTISEPCTVTAVAGTNISTAYVAEGQTFPAGTTTTTLNMMTENYATFQATANSGFAFSGWYDENNNLVSTANPYTCLVHGNLTLTAKGVPAYTVTAAKETGISTAYVAAGTSFSGSATSVTVAEGGSATFQAAVSSGYGFSGWYDEQDALVSTNQTYTVNNITGNFTLTAKASVVHTVTVASTTNGTVTANPTSTFMGETVTLTVTPSNNYAIGNIVVTGTSGNTYAVAGVGSSYTFTMPDEDVTVTATFFQKSNDAYRGFYAWRVKNLSDGLTIKSKDGNTTYGVNSILYADQEVQFITANAEGNEVEFEALWAKAYVTTGTSAMSSRATNSGNYQNAYERNFHVVTSLPSHSTYPYTITTLNPDGSGSLGTITRNSDYSAPTDVKFENMYLRMSNNYINAAGHSLFIGRGVKYNANNSTNVANHIYGYYYTGNSVGNVTINSFSLRIESGRFPDAYMFTVAQNYCRTTSSNTWKMLWGSDYDRAKNSNSNLVVSGAVEVAKYFNFTSASGSINAIVMSGTYGANSDNTEFYMGYEANSSDYSSQAPRTLEVLGGIFQGGIAGGIERSVAASTMTLNMRIKGGTINQYVYGAGQYSAAAGSRKTVITGGTFSGWVAGGCYGTDSNDQAGETDGDCHIYFGGDANMTNTEGIFGGGYGRGNAGDNKYTINKSFVVVADEAQIAGNVYGGGNKGYCTDNSEVYVKGTTLKITGSVYGGANLARTEGTTTVTVKSGSITGSVYGGALGSSATSNTVYVTGKATVNVEGGTMTNVYGGGLGSYTRMNNGTEVNIKGGTINNNVYGGGALGTVNAVGTTVTVEGGTMNDVFGAGMGSSTQRANITGSTSVAVSGGTVNGSVYGGGQNGTVAYAASGANNTNYKSTVGVSGGEVKGNVYGGGKMGTSQVATFVNISNGTIRGHVFGGAEGEQKKVFVTGMRTVNMTGGHVYGNVYGGSQNANDGNNTTLDDGDFATNTTTTTMCVTNISGGIIDENVYAAGFFGNCFGSVYVFIGKDAIQNAPYKQPTTGIDYKVATLSITGTVWAGGDWGTFSGTFGSGTISGNSNVYVDGNGYETTTQQANNAQYMNIGGSILACGTSCYAGKAERTVIIRNYGTAQGAQPTEASRTLFSIQFAKVLIFDNSNINFTGQGRANQLNQTEKYSLYEIYNDSKQTNVDTDVDGVRIVNGSGLFLNAPVTQIANFRSMSCTNTFASTTPTLTGYTAITPETLSSCNNQVRVNNGNYIEIKWGSNYGALIGYAHMMASNNGEDATCAYARPRWCTGAAFEQNSGTDNPNDGGWISYTASENTVALDGTAGNVQMPYENHTVAKNGEQYFRIWRQGGKEHYREGIFNAHASGTEAWKTVDVVVTLPAFRDPANYYCFETNGDATTIDYGADVLMWNAARQTGTGNDWMYFNEDTEVQMTGQPQSAVESTLTEMKKNADVNFGLVILPSTGMAGSNYIICYEADNNLALGTTKFTKADNTKEPQVTFRLTYYDKLTSNMTWDPSSIVLVQKDATGKVVDRVTISLAVSTTSTIEQVFTTQLYAIMQGKGSTSETFNAKVVLPSFAANLYATGRAANFKLNSVNFVAANDGNLIARAGTYNYNNYAVGYAASLNYDNSDGWNGDGIYTEQDAEPMVPTIHPNPTATSIGKTGGRTAFAIDFTLHYDGSQTASTEELIGTLTFNFTFDNYKGIDENGNPYEITAQPLTIVVEVYRRGQGKRFYIDGINGSNANKGRHPDKAVKQLSTIFNRCGYMAGDEIYIVNQVTANKQLDWNGLPYNNVTIYRYNGGHELSAADASIVGNPNNTAYLGNLLNVTNHMTMTGITLDGYYNNGETGTDDNGGPHTVTATASMVTVAQGGTLELSLGTVLQNNNSSSVNGAAVNVANGGKMMMNQDATIKDNVTTGDGGGVYMAGTMVASDAIQIVNNKKGEAQNNVFLTAADKVITIGTASASDAYGELSADAKIGVTKGLSADIDGTYTRVVNVDQDVEWLETPFNTHPNSIIYHDGQKYQLVNYSDPKYLYWVGTWVTLQDHVPTAEEGGWPYTSSTTTFDINTEYQFAWIISLVNGENNQTPDNFSGKTINILADIDMDESIWVPIGTDAHPFKGTLKGNGHLIENMRSSLVQDYMGMLGYAEGATVQDVMAAVNFDANSANMGAVAGVMKTTTISNVEAAGTITGGSNTVNMGGIVGDVQSGTIHSSFAVCDLECTTGTVLGGLVGTNGGNLYNSFANTTMTGATQMGGLVGENKANCHVENCYVNLGQMEIPAFAYTNKGAIAYCYASKAGQYVSADVTDNVAPTKSGIFAAVKDRKHLDYMYRDNIVTAPEANTYANHEGIEYTNNTHAPLVWNGLLSVLNQWVDKTEVEGDFSSWYRPTTNTINGDLPVLAFPKDNCLGNFAEEDGKFLRYSAYDLTAGTSFNNGLDGLFTHYSGKAANIFLYNNATNVANGSGNANLFINEDAVLLQSGSDAINATVGVTFDNSDHGQNAYDYYGNQLKYDWHFMSTPLSNASTGASYSGSEFTNQSNININGMVNGYFPNGLGLTTPAPEGSVMWDFYTYYEPHYHWINLKRGPGNHWHTDGGAIIPYVEDDNTATNATFVPGKGYMMAISQDSYMSNSGVLNNGDVTITLTNGEPQSLQYNKGWNLVGNPYQAYLDLKAVRTGANASYYIYDAESGDYVPYAVGASQNTVTPSRYIHPHQGFFMHAEPEEGATTETLTFTPGMATTEKEDGSYFRGDEQINYPLVNLFARSQAGNNDLAIIELNRPEIGGATKMSFMTNANFELSAYLDGQDYGLLFTPEGTEKVPVHFTTQEDGTYTLTWDTQNGVFTSLLLVDNMTGTITDMLRSDHYTFDAKTSDYASRFYLTYACTGVEEVNEGDGSFAFFDGSEWVVNGKGQLDIIDVTGRVLFSKRIANEQNRVNLNNVAPGVYMMRVSDGKDTMVQKIVVR